MFSFKKSLVVVITLATLLVLIAVVTPIRSQGQGSDNQQPLDVNVFNAESASALVRDVGMSLRTPLQSLRVSNIRFTEDILFNTPNTQLARPR
ncbi:MAG TPA: hypothetical protein VLA93_00820 [Pyrinomonadaceae bacterium]|nr:hypothetical protein [Pyrinomonadaceae bacterium]